jgi:aspartyl-tRNA(Asn)/glutamyl-tRNA(Gln) amidotransferase subunit C
MLSVSVYFRQKLRCRSHQAKGRIILHPLSKIQFAPPPTRCFTPGFQRKYFMSLTSSDIARIANLARLELKPLESERMLTQINGFFDLVETMRAVDTSGVAPLAHPMATIQDITLRLREDSVSEPNNREANQRNAPAVEVGLFLVPKVIE